MRLFGPKNPKKWRNLRPVAKVGLAAMGPIRSKLKLRFTRRLVLSNSNSILGSIAKGTLFGVLGVSVTVRLYNRSEFADEFEFAGDCLPPRRYTSDIKVCPCLATWMQESSN